MWKIRLKHQKLIEQETLLFDILKDFSNNYAVVYPNKYSIGMSNLGFNFLFKELNSRGDSSGERFFYEEDEDEILSMESNRSLSEFEVILFSLTYELDYINLLRLMIKSEIEIFGDRRTRLFPILIGGGAALTINPAPLLKILDFIFLGNADKEFSKIIEIINRKDYRDKLDLYNKLKDIPGIIPGEHIKKIKALNISYSVPEKPVHSAIITPNAELKNMFLIETARGCPYNCSFCSVKKITGKYKKFPAEAVVSVLERHKGKFEKVGLVSSAVLENNEIKKIFMYGIENNLTMNTSSLRLDLLDEVNLELLLKAGNRTLTLAIESGDENLRFESGKKVSDEKIFSILKNAVNTGFRSFKFYLIIGMPGETDEHLKNTIRFFSELRNSVEIKALRMNLSINPFIAKPGTKWEKGEFINSTEMKRKFNILNKSLKKLGYSCQIENLNEAELQYLFANSNSEIIYPVIEKLNESYSVILKEVKNYAKDHRLSIDHNISNT
ncbi:MAG: radical SAM protein [bacterium]|nr:radical SAM protein [bacterium]